MTNLINDYEIALVDDDSQVLKSTSQLYRLHGLNVECYSSAKELLASISDSWKGVVVSDVRMPEISGVELLSLVHKVDSEIPVILLSGYSDIPVVINAIRQGAYDFIEKNTDPELTIEVIKRAMTKRQLVLENRELKATKNGATNIDQVIVGQSPSMLVLKSSISQLAPLNVDVLIYGPTGAGKEVVAQTIHDFSTRRSGPFVAINCGGMASSIIESELFGHEAGAFTGANKQRAGKFEYADGGTLFLDEVESMPMDLQIKLLRVLQERKIERLGSNKQMDLDVRIIAASKADLKEESKNGNFRQDLFYRLDVARVDIPALDQRKDDIPLLFAHFADLAFKKYGTPFKEIDNQVLQIILTKSWEGNVRELRSAAERWAMGLAISMDINQFELNDALSFDQQVENFEIQLINAALDKCKGNMNNTAEMLGINRKKLYRRLKKQEP